MTHLSNRQPSAVAPATGSPAANRPPAMVRENWTGACGLPVSSIWLTHMKTTVEIADALFDNARRIAQREGTTMRAVIEDGLRLAFQQRRATPKGFTPRDATFGGDGLAPGVSLEDWNQLRSLTYEERGG